MVENDIIIVGSGPSGVMAARTLVEAGKRVILMDGGKHDRQYQAITPSQNFVDLRENDLQQHKYFLGNTFEGINLGKNKVGAQLTPSRQYLIEGVHENLSIDSDSFFPMESLAIGGLGGGWGTGCYCFSNPEMKLAGLDADKMDQAYRLISKRIGISGTNDDSTEYCSRNILELQNPIRIEENIQHLFQAYQKKKKILNAKGIFAGRSALALLSEDFNNRKACDYSDMEFWSDHNQSAWRAWMEVNELKKKENFKHLPGLLVKTFSETSDTVTVRAIHLESKKETEITAKRLILAAGAIGTARIVLETHNENVRIPLLCNNYLYYPFIQWRRIGKGFEKNKSSLSQLVLYFDPNGKNENVSLAALFSYRSLLLFKLIREAPISMRSGREIFRFLHPAITLAGIHHPEKYGEDKYLEWNGHLKAKYIYSESEQVNFYNREKEIVRGMMQLGCFPLKKIKTPAGSSIHYAGTLPFSNDNRKFHLSPNGKLGSFNNVFVADGSGFKFLPAKGITLSLMANAHLTAKEVLSEIG